ncbi:helix-turn-helix domain-containing protein [Streptomyces sp. Tu 3180]|uniref:helix-turn-helix domain-containing protein n=1 Tax=Streptomyces sp. Tu 3180 TaxID=2682611 RepID=UPI001357DC29|nr:helix-turn-helix domain-containing protein [Streptomyces sp. Tu 3180]KAF3467091.1 helix-turn-helix domain-containing protein [Streptomyces sp. Tu 3180]
MTRRSALPLPPPEERRRLREANALTPGQLAARAGVDTGTVRAWESGRTAPRGRKREAYAKLLAALAESAARAGTRESAPARHREEPDAGTVTARPQEPVLGGRRGPVAPEPSAFAQAPPPSSPRDPAPAFPPGEQDSPGPAHGLTPAQAFDALYAFCAPALVRQAYLLTGHRDLARESVERAFQRAWEHWPEVARDPDPAGWVRAAAHEWALSPWHRFRLRHRRSGPPPPDPSDRALLEVLLRLPPPYRRTLLLYDGIGLDLPDVAAETEASTPATAGRLLHAREAVAARLPELSDPRVLHRRLAELASAERLRAARPTAVRDGGERRARFWTRTSLAFTAALIGTTAYALYTAPDGYEPPVPPGEKVRGVPPRVAPGPLSKDQQELRSKLRRELLHGPDRLAPQPR